MRCHSSSTALGTRTGYWKATRRGTDETPRNECSILESADYNKFHSSNEWAYYNSQAIIKSTVEMRVSYQNTWTIIQWLH